MARKRAQKLRNVTRTKYPFRRCGMGKFISAFIAVNLSFINADEKAAVSHVNAAGR